MPISTFQFTNLGPFDEVEFEFDPRVNVLVGPNNCGKTTVLVALADVLLPDFELPQKLLRGKSRFSAELETQRGGRIKASSYLPAPNPNEFARLGRSVLLETPDRYLLEMPKLGYRAYIPALRMSTDFRSKGPAAAKERPAKASRRAGVESASEGAASWIRDEGIIQQIVEIDYRAYREKKPAMHRTLQGIGALVSQITEGFSGIFF